MSSSFNTFTAVGRLGRDPEVRYFESGNVVAKFSIAVDKPPKRDQPKDEKPDWFDVEFWGKTAEVCANYVRKGSLIGVEGRIEFEHWLDKVTNNPRSRPVVKGNRLHLLGSKNDGQRGEDGPPDDYYTTREASGAF